MMYKQGDTCPICGVGKINVSKRRESFEYKGRVLNLNLTVYSCDTCKEEFYDNEEMAKYDSVMKDFIQRVKGGYDGRII